MANLRLLNAVWNFYRQNIDFFETIFLQSSDYKCFESGGREIEWRYDIGGI